MELFEAIGKRHSYRGPFTDAPVREEDLRKIVQAGIQAPSGKNEQTTSFVILNDPALVRQAAEIINRPACQTARAMIVCVTDPRPTFYGHSFHAEDCAAAVENMLLAAHDAGLGACWLGEILARREDVEALLEVPGDMELVAVVALGRPARQPGAGVRHPLEKLVLAPPAGRG